MARGTFTWKHNCKGNISGESRSPPTDPPTSSYAEDVEGWQCVRVLVKIEAGGMQVQDFQGRMPTSVPRRRL